MYLDAIVASKRAKLDALDRARAIQQWERTIAQSPPTRSLVAALRQSPRRTTAGVAVIAEVKKASPSKGLIRPQFDPVAIADAYVAARVDALSVLTEEDHFLGAPAVLTAIRERVALPLLRKDFLFDPLQVLEARAMGADAILLIAALLTPDTLRTLWREAQNVGLEAIVEVHDEAELAWVCEQDVPIIGINNRNLKTFVVDLAVTERLIQTIPTAVGDRCIVSESGIATPDDVLRVRSAGAHAILVGEQFMRQPDVTEAVHQLVGDL